MAKRILSLVLVLALALSVALPAMAELDTSKQEELTFVLLGDQPKDMQSVADQLNELTMRDFNCTINWVFLGWDKWQDKYNLKLASGEKIDLIYTASWAQYLALARKGAYLPLDEYLPEYAPQSWANMTVDQWNGARVAGKIYTVPCDWEELKSNGILYRADMAEEFGIQNPITTWEDMELYFQKCLEKDPNTIPFNETSGKIKDSVIQAALGQYQWVVNESAYYGVTLGNTTDVINYFETEEFKTFVARMKSWYDQGFWSKNVLSNQTEGETLFQQGLTYACKSNIAGVESVGRDWIAQHPDWKVNIFLNADVKGFVNSNPVIGNGVAVPRTCSDIPRSLAVLDKLRYDPDYYMLTQYGILGKHYNLDDKGCVVPLGSNDDVGFGSSAMQPWGWHVDRMEPPAGEQWAGKQELYDRMHGILRPNYVDSFAFDVTPVSAQFAALENVFNQYVLPLIVGKTDDVDADIAKVNEQLKNAGIDDYLKEVKTQLDAFFAENGF